MQIEYSISHEVSFSVPNEFGVGKPEKLWVRLGSTDTQQEGETPHEAVKRISDFVHSEALKAAYRAVQGVRDK